MSVDERRILCPGCGMKIPVPWDAKEGDLIECENCAGVKFRLDKEDGADILRIVQLVSCPICGEHVPVDDDTPEGAAVFHGGARFLLRKEFGAFSLELAEGEQSACSSFKGSPPQ